MGDATRLIRDDSYDDMASSYQGLQVLELDAAMQTHGIADAAVRRSICETFLFQMGYFDDRGWLKPTSDAQSVYPLLCFTKQFVGTETAIDQLGDVIATSELHSFHEYARGNASLLYEGDPLAQVETGESEDDV